MLGFDVHSNFHCKGINIYIINRIAREKPDRVILAAHWGFYPIEDGGMKVPSYTVEQLRKVAEARLRYLPYTVEQLRKAGVKRIDVIGLVPEWKDGLPKNLYNFFKKNHRVPQRMNLGLDPRLWPYEQLTQNFATQLGINYISAIKVLCNEEGCLTRAGENMDSLTQWDNGHLTTVGSEFLVSHFPN